MLQRYATSSPVGPGLGGSFHNPRLSLRLLGFGGTLPSKVLLRGGIVPRSCPLIMMLVFSSTPGHAVVCVARHALSGAGVKDMKRPPRGVCFV